MKANDMIIKTHNLPFHKVVLHYKPDKTPSNFEEELVKRYLGFLNQMQEMREQMEPLSKSYYKEQYIIEEHVKRIEDFTNSYKATKEQLESMIATKDIEINTYFELRKQFYSTNKEYLQYHNEQVNPWRELINDNEKTYQQLYDWFYDEGSDNAYQHFADYGRELYENWDQYAIDLVQYDQNVDKMKEQWSKASTEFDALHQLREETVEMSRPITENLNKVNKAAELLQQHFNELDLSRKTFNN